MASVPSNEHSRIRIKPHRRTFGLPSTSCGSVRFISFRHSGTRRKADSQQGWFGLPDDSLLNHSQGLLQLWALSSPKSFRQMSGFQRTVVCTLLMPTVLTTFDHNFEQESRPADHRLDLPKPSRSFCRSEPDYFGIYQRHRCSVRRRPGCQRLAVPSW